MKPTKKIYSTPRLIKYGDVRGITALVGNTSKTNDGGTGRLRHKTH